MTYCHIINFFLDIGKLFIRRVMRILLIALLAPAFAYASCENSDLKVSVNLTSKTFDNSYEDEAVNFAKGDSIVVLEKSSNQEYTYATGTFSNDGFGNFSVESEEFLATGIYLDHDHEVWHTDGLSGEFITPKKTYDLASLICSFDDLFLID